MLARLDKEVEAWRKADPATPVQPALHLIAVVAQAAPGRDGKYRLRMADTLIERVASWAAQRNALLFLDIQVGHSTVQEELPRLIPFLKRPNVHLGLDPEFSMKPRKLKDGSTRERSKPGERIGAYDASDVNYTIGLLSDLVTENNLPPKVLVVHRFTHNMLTNAKKIKLDPRVQVVIHWTDGASRAQYDSYRATSRLSRCSSPGSRFSTSTTPGRAIPSSPRARCCSSIRNRSTSSISRADAESRSARNVVIL